MDGGLVLVAQTSVCGVPLELAEILDWSEFSYVCGPSILAFGNNPGLLKEPPQTEQAAEKLGFGVILSEAKNLSSI
jgi:hypothetical protein